jgi:phospholipid transport system substrate-binding protein
MTTRRELVMALAASAALAWPVGAAAQGEDAAVARIKAFYDGLQKAMASADPKQRLAAVSDAMMRTFDIAAMTRLAVGPQWSKIPVARRDSLQEAFGRYFIASYANRLGQAAGGRFEVLPQTEKRAGGRLVRTRVTDAQGKETPVDYLVNADGKVVDVYLGGTVSELASRRSDFAAAMKAGGPDALEANLRKQADELMGRK